MVFRIEYRQLFRKWLVLNVLALALTAGVLLYNDHHHHFEYSEFYNAVSFTNFAVLLLLIFEGQLLFIEIDKATGKVKYQRFFRHFTAVELDYDGVRAGFTTRNLGRNNPAKVLAFYYNGDEQFYVFTGNGWTETKLNAMHKLVKQIA